jgi:murein L,D-transpeptidase YcbB/YkuD
MRGRCLVATHLITALALAAILPAYAVDQPASIDQQGISPTLEPGLPAPTAAPEPKPVPEPTPAQPISPPPMPATPAPSVAPVDQPPLASNTSGSPPVLVVQSIRAKLADPDMREGANAGDLAALESFYSTRSGGPLWMTEMGFTAKGQSVLFEIEKAAEWGLDAAAFELPSPDALTASPEVQALAEIKLDLALLKYARFARGGRLSPTELSKKWDQAPSLRDPKAVLAEIEATDAPDAYLQSLHPKHEQFMLLRYALLKARGDGEKGAKSKDSDRDIRRLIINMERWRFMPEDLGSLYVWSNTPEFMLYVVKDGKAIYADKTQVGTIGYQTPVFSADMKTIVFNPEWIAPPTVLRENLLPALRKKNYAVLAKHAFSVSYQGNPVNPAKVDWAKVNILNYTFTQRAGPHSNVGKAKFLYPNKHLVYMHDTFPERRKYFHERVRAVGHDCIRMEKPDQFARVLLEEANGWQASQVKELWDKSVNSPATLDRKIPVHMTYFTAVVDETGKVSTFDDLYGLDNKLAIALFGDAKGFPMPQPEQRRSPRATSASAKWTPANDGVAGSLQDFLGE